MQKTKWYEESPGVTSSRRLAGGGTVVLALAMKVSLFVLSLFTISGDPITAGAQADGMLYAGLGLLGVTGLADLFKRSGA